MKNPVWKLFEPIEKSEMAGQIDISEIKTTAEG